MAGLIFVPEKILPFYVPTGLPHSPYGKAQLAAYAQVPLTKMWGFRCVGLSLRGFFVAWGLPLRGFAVARIPFAWIRGCMACMLACFLHLC